MKLVEGVDYWVRQVEFPNMGSPSVAASNGDGTFTIYLNTCFSAESRERGLRHELRHLSEGHFYRDDLGLGAIEDAADGSRPEPSGAGLPPGCVPFYTGAGDFLEHFLRGASPGTLRRLREARLLPCDGDSSH